MKRILTAAQMKQADRNTIETMGVPSLVLMERAALSCVEELQNGTWESLSWFGRDRKARVCPEIFYNHRGEKLILLVQQGDDLFVLNFQCPQRIVHDLHLQLHLRI